MSNRYSFNIEWSEDDEEYIATCPAFPGLMALPEPVIHEAVSGKFQLRLPKSLHRLAVRMAELESVSLNSRPAKSTRRSRTTRLPKKK